MIRAFGLSIVAFSAFAADTASISRIEPEGYAQCYAEMKGHESRRAEIRVCHDGNGTYVESAHVLELIAGRDWFPEKEFGGYIGEVRVVCALEGRIQDRVVPPAGKNEPARIELSCRHTTVEAERALENLRKNARGPARRWMATRPARAMKKPR